MYLVNPDVELGVIIWVFFLPNGAEEMCISISTGRLLPALRGRLQGRRLLAAEVRGRPPAPEHQPPAAAAV